MDDLGREAQRQHLLDANLTEVRARHARGLRDGIKEPAILLFDLRDERAREVAATSSSEECVDAALLEYAGTELIPILILTCERGVAYRVTHFGEPPVHEPTPGPGEFLGVVIGEGGPLSVIVTVP